MAEQPLERITIKGVVDKLADKEIEALRKKAEVFKPETVDEPKLPLDMGAKAKLP